MEPSPRVTMVEVGPHKALTLGPLAMLPRGPKVLGGLGPQSPPKEVHTPRDSKGMAEVEPLAMNPPHEVPQKAPQVGDPSVGAHKCPKEGSDPLPKRHNDVVQF